MRTHISLCRSSSSAGPTLVAASRLRICGQHSTAQHGACCSQPRRVKLCVKRLVQVPAGRRTAASVLSVRAAAASGPHLLPCATVGLVFLGGEAHAVNKRLAGLWVCDGQALQQQAACLQQVLVDDTPGLHACGGWRHSKRMTCCCFKGAPVVRRGARHAHLAAHACQLVWCSCMLRPLLRLEVHQLVRPRGLNMLDRAPQLHTRQKRHAGVSRQVWCRQQARQLRKRTGWNDFTVGHTAMRWAMGMGGPLTICCLSKEPSPAAGPPCLLFSSCIVDCCFWCCWAVPSTVCWSVFLMMMLGLQLINVVIVAKIGTLQKKTTAGKN